MDVPSMVHRSGGTLIVRSVVSGNQIYLDQETGNVVNNPPPAALQSQQQPQHPPPSHMQDNDIQSAEEHTKDEGLPQCKIKRNYSCSYCTYFTQNPRYHLTHLRDVHGEKIVINKCKLCLYASRHYQKLVRHMKMVHGSTEGIAGNHGQSRKRNLNREAVRKRKTDSLENGLILQSNLQHLQQQLEQQQQKQVQQQIKQQLEQQELQQQQQALLQFTLPKVESLAVSIDDAPQNRLLKCSLCDFTTLYRAQLVDHEQEEHCRTKFFRCDKCTYVTHIKARFSKHVKYHSMPMIKCVTCDFRTPYKWNLDRHMKNHGGVGPFRCAACDFTADIKQSLTVHEMNHHVPPVGHAAGMSLARRRNKVGGTDNSDDYLSDPGDVDDQFNNNNNNIDDIDENYAKRCKYDLPDDDEEDKEQPTDLSQKGGGSDAGSQHLQKKPVRPVPNLIPIQAATNAINLTKEPAPSRNSFKELASLYFDKDQIPEIIMQMDKVDAAQLSPSSNHSTASKRKATSSSFFDELKSFADESARNENLSCSCGHVSKCLSESFIHRKTCNYSYEDKHSSISPINLTVNCSGSTRCQHCRHRCKSSADLLNHLKNCSDAGRSQNDSFDSMSMSGGSSGGRQEHDDDGAGSEDMSKHPMENRVFVWNKMPGVGSSAGGGSCGGGSVDGANGSGSSKSDVNGNLDAKNLMLMGGSGGGGGVKNEDNSYYGVETAPGYGEMTPEEEAANSSLKKVYKCPHCSFWASTASRFHVHIVGHLNKKPFECSLCAYRSNWRWDITKHIRLKTIRDPTHKNARVLMNDETGRRNYTKYNKYITLMKVTDEDGDPKLMKSGEMTPNQIASLALLSDFNKSNSECVLPNGIKSSHSQDGDSLRDRQKIDASDSGVDTNGYMRLPLLVFNAAIAQQKEQQEQLNASAPGTKRSPPPLIKPSDDLITDIKTEGQEKKKLYKCRKCHFRHANRDAALAHVKVHCQDQQIFASPSSSKSNHHNPSLPASVNPTSIYMNKVLAAAMCLSQNQLLQEQKSSPNSSGSSSATNNQHSTLSSAASAVGSGLQQAISPKALAAIQAAGTTIEHGEITDERHCRLKHSGDIRIETLDRNSSAPVYRPLGIAGSGQSGHVLGSSADSFILGRLKSAHNQPQNKGSVLSKDDNHPQGESPCHTDPYSGYDLMMNSGGTERNKSDQDFRYDLLMNNNEISRLAADRNKSEQDFRYDLLMNSTEIGRLNSTAYSLPSNKSKQQKCPSCPYISESKSQMNYHISLHKPTQYECNLCSYVCTKKQHLSNHVKAMHENSGPFTLDAPAAIDLRSKQSHDSDDEDLSKVIAYCPKCPARFVNSPRDMQLHSKAHGASFEYQCEACDFSTKQETILLSHSYVHTSTYQEKTEQIAKNAKEDSEFPAKKMKQITLPKTGATVWVVAESRDVSTFNGDGSSLLKKQLENGSLKESASPTSSASPSLSSISEINEPEKCAHCPFQSIYSDAFKRHLQCHISVSNKTEKYTCDHCDFSTASEALLTEHTPIHFESIEGRKSVAFFTSYDNLELIVTNEDDTKKSEEPPKPISFGSNAQHNEKSAKDPATSPNLRRSSRSSAHNGEEKSSPPPPPPPPPPSSHKTILVNPKTGQVIRRN